MPTVLKIDSVYVQPNNRMRRTKNNQNRAFLANRSEKTPEAGNSILNRMVSKALEKMSPVLFKHPRTSKKLFALGETLAKRAANIQE